MRSHSNKGSLAPITTWSLSSLLIASGVAAQPVFVDLGVLTNGAGAGVTAISDDGLTVAGTGTVGQSQIAFHRTEQITTELGFLPDGTSSIGSDINGDGSVVVGTSRGSVSRAFRWTAGGSLMDLGFLTGGSGAGAWAVSRDGLTIVGAAGYAGAMLGRSHAIRWLIAGSTVTRQDLGTLLGGSSSRALSMSPDGSTVVGASYTTANGSERAFRWRMSTGTMQNLSALPGSIASEARSVTANGNLVVGFCTLNTVPTQTSRAFKWVDNGTTTGTLQPLPLLDDDLFNEAYAVSDDGSRIVGTVQTESAGSFAVMWTSTGVVTLNAYLETLNLDLADWRLVSANSISADGRCIGGIGGFNGQQRGWLVRNLPPHCSADFNGVGGVTVQDIFDFLVAYFANDARADVNLSGSVSLQDIFDYLTTYFAGCP